MTQNKNKAAMRYAARLACIYDWSVYGCMDRTMEKLSRQDCLDTITALSRLTDPLAEKLWSIVGDLFPGIGNGDIEKADKWVLPELVRNYDMQKREILATQRLREVFNSEDDLTIFDVERLTGTYCWEFNGWLDSRNSAQETKAPKKRVSAKIAVSILIDFFILPNSPSFLFNYAIKSVDCQDKC